MPALLLSDLAVLPVEWRPARPVHVRSSLPGLRGGGVWWYGVSFGPGFINTPALGIELLALWTVAPEHSWLTRCLFPFASARPGKPWEATVAPLRETGEGSRSTPEQLTRGLPRQA